jgi:hypothetical protein
MGPSRSDRTPSRDPLAGVRLIVVDGNNLAHALSQRPEPGPRAAVVGRIRGAVPPEVAIELVFDGPPEPGATVRAASHVTVRYGGRRPADLLVIERLEVEAGTPGQARALARDPARSPDILVVTDDAQLARASRARGAATARTSWLIGRMERGRLVSPSVGNARAPKPTGRDVDREAAAEADGRRWEPGRGATTKHGNASRPPKAARGPRGGSSGTRPRMRP